MRAALLLLLALPLTRFELPSELRVELDKDVHIERITVIRRRCTPRTRGTTRDSMRSCRRDGGELARLFTEAGG